MKTIDEKAGEKGAESGGAPGDQAAAEPKVEEKSPRAVRRNGQPGMGAESGGALGDRVVRGGEIVTEDEVGSKRFKALLENPGFTLVKTLLLVLAMAGILAGPMPAQADDTGTYITYDSKIGWGGAKLSTLPTVLGTVDTAFSGVKGSVHSPVADITALKAIGTTGATARADRQLCFVDSGPGSKPTLYVFDSSSSTAGDDDLVVAPASGTGRWLKVEAQVHDSAVTTAKIANGAILFEDWNLNSCTAGQVPGVNSGATAWECKAPPPAAVNPSVADNVVTFSNTTGGQKDSGIGSANLVTNATGAAAGADYVISSAGADKSIKSSGVLVANVPTMASAASGANLAMISGGADKTLVAGKVTLTQPATGSTLTVADGKTLTCSNTLTFTGTDSSSVAFGAGGTVAYTADKLSAFASTTSAELAGVVSDETGSGSLVFSSALPTNIVGLWDASLADLPALPDGSLYEGDKILVVTSGNGRTAGKFYTVAAGNTWSESTGSAVTGDIVICKGAKGNYAPGWDPLPVWMGGVYRYYTGGIDRAVMQFGNFTGDTGSGGAEGLVPGPGIGDSAAGKYLSASGTWSVPPVVQVCGSASATTTRGAVSYSRVGASTGTIALSGESTRTGTLHVEITVSGEADGACKFQWKYNSEALNGADLDCATTGTAIASGITVTFTNGTPLSFEDGDDMTSAISLGATINARCGLITVDLTTPASGSDTIVLSDTSVTANSVAILSPIRSGSATNGSMGVTNWVPWSGTLTLSIANYSVSASNGTWLVPFYVPGDVP